MKRMLKFILIFAFCLAAALGTGIAAVMVYVAQHPEPLSVREESISCGAAKPIRVVQLSDLHNAEFGEGNGELIETIQAQQPDLIVMSGDMLNRDDENLDVLTSLITALKEIAPVYYGYGNHEKDWELQWGRGLVEPLSEAGAIVLDCDYRDLEINGTPIRIGGYMGYYRYSGMTTSDPARQEAETAFFDDFEASDALKILLNHIPTQWVDWGNVEQFDVDLVFSGHYHGGMIQLPLIHRGLYAPYVEWFPENTKGVFAGEKAACVLSGGLGSEHPIPRINNPPEIVVVDLLP